jgi:hypothetical protein
VYKELMINENYKLERVVKETELILRSPLGRLRSCSVIAEEEKEEEENFLY